MNGEHFTIESEGKTTVVLFKKACIINPSEAERETLLNVLAELETEASLILDFKNTGSLRTNWLNLFVELTEEANKFNKKVILTNVPPDIPQNIRYTGMDGLLHIESMQSEFV